MAGIRPYTAEKYMLIDSSSRGNLELVETPGKKIKEVLFFGCWTKQKQLWEPVLSGLLCGAASINGEEINQRLEALEELNQNPMLRDEIREYLNPIYDLERLISRISYHLANPRDLVAFSSSLEMLPHIRQILKEFKSPLLVSVCEDMDPLKDLADLIKRAIVEEPPLAQKNGGIIREGYHPDVRQYPPFPHRRKEMACRAGSKEKENVPGSKPEDQVQSCIWLFS